MAVSSSLLLLLMILGTQNYVSGEKPRCKAWLVESVPTNMPELRRIPGMLQTGDVLQWIAGNATESLDVTAQYWQLLSHPERSDSGEYGFSKAAMNSFGADVGRQVHASLEKAAERGLPIRIAQHSGVYPDFVSESTALAAGRSNVQNRTLLLKDWWGTGIIHQKVWIADKKHFYVGSANNDWKSLTQVKELGIYLTDCPQIGGELTQFFDNVWALTTLNASKLTKTVWDEKWQANRLLPCWSLTIPAADRCRSPLPPYYHTKRSKRWGYSYVEDPLMFDLELESPGDNPSKAIGNQTYLSFAPSELLFKNHQSDEQALVETILSVPVNGTVRINTMNWLSRSQFTRPQIFWTALYTAIGKVVLAKGATVKILAADWSHNIRGQTESLRSLEDINSICGTCVGKVQVKLFQVPDFNSTGPFLDKNQQVTGNKYPDYSRVSHAKFAVSDVRAHIGTSNMIWDYYHNTGGVSLGTYNPILVARMQQVFEADWESPYTVPVGDPSAILVHI